LTRHFLKQEVDFLTKTIQFQHATTQGNGYRQIMRSSTRPIPIRLTPFTLSVMDFVKKIPRGQVATYSQIARLAGKSHAARGVGWILNSCAKKYKLPWQRVINREGKISFPVDTREFAAQKRLLLAEGIQFISQSGVDLRKYQWKKSVACKKL